MRGDDVWLYDSGGSDVVVYEDREDGLRELLKRCRVTTVDELVTVASVEVFDDGSISVDDGPSLDRAVIR